MSSAPIDRKDSVGLIPTAEIRAKKVVNTRFIVLILLALIALGTFNLYSASGGGDIFYQQLKHVSIGLTLFVVCGWLIPPRFWNTYAYWIFGVIVMMLIAVLVVGRVAGGSQRWLHIGPFGGQPSELAKLVVAMIVAKYFYTSKQQHPYRLRDMIPVLAMVGLVFCLIFPQPDFGTAGLCALVAIVQLCFIRLDKRSVTMVFGTVVAALPMLWFFGLEGYQKDRVLTFLRPDADPLGKGYNALQSLVAIGSGGLTGKGFMQGTQTQLQFLPMSHTDFVFSVFAEERGFWGGSILFLLFGAIAYLGLEIARQAKDSFNALLAIGCTAFIFMEFAVNVAMVLRMFPVVGIPLPFFTYGGSILLTICSSLGILVSIDRDNLGLIKKSTSLKRAQ
jgi:rod shape determining protein RodA